MHADNSAIAIGQNVDASHSSPSLRKLALTREFSEMKGRPRSFDAALDAVAAHLASLDESKSDKAKLEACRKALVALRSDMDTFKEHYGRNMVEMLKVRSINSAPGAAPLRTSAYTVGEERALRKSPERETKKSKRPSADVSAVVALK